MTTLEVLAKLRDEMWHRANDAGIEMRCWSPDDDYYKEAESKLRAYDPVVHFIDAEIKRLEGEEKKP